MNVATSSPVDDLLNPGESASRPIRILAAAGRMFIEHGYEGTSMEEIAKAAAVTRQTLYNRFPEGKESLFVAVAERMWKAFPVMNVATDERALVDPRSGLMQIGTEFACFWSGPAAADFLRMVIMEGRRFPVLADRFDEVIQAPAMSVISDYLAELARRGVLVVQEPATAARDFMETLDGRVLWKQVRANSEPLAREEIEYIVERTVDTFLRSLRH
ncbi:MULTISPECIES: TetR/AcrR family transcriptional regulator [unclassified Pseudomonas]|uniref:TetR/AcrR family transcriptional regulator n=1 Tax=unclassified Pseudomonas TaxID=196821 RepID=UPI002096E5E1|nr:MULTISPECIES: TetR/AcrR family transcriptional regulator [unclassified Pseudomonas]MCO7504758.1 TetR/AcrR family transcriptional regulator [Pseudomonas sp. VE 267-6A]MCO7529463.1 TetR/AcrR family transcriptional regulator [Pseudomonas sp. 2]